MASSTSSSASVVFATTELVEQILLQLPLIDKFVATRINRLCRSTAQTAGSLRLGMQMAYFKDDTLSSRRRLANSQPTRFFLGNSSILFDTNPLFLSGLGSLFHGTTHRGLYKGHAKSSSGQCPLHFDTAPFYITLVQESETAGFRHISMVFRWRPSEAWLDGRRTSVTFDPKVDGKLLSLASRGSWENMRVSPLPLPVKVTAIVTTPTGCHLFSPTRRACHKDRFSSQTERFCLVLQPMDAILGNMMRFLHELGLEALRIRQVWKQEHSDGST